MADEQMRIGDRERDAAVTKLQDFHAEGRLSVEEFDQRMSAALTAKTAAELAQLFVDLPGGAANASSYGPEREYPNQYQAAPPYPVAYQQPYYTPVPHQPMVRKPEIVRPWYAQWWMIFLPVLLTVVTDGRVGGLFLLMALWLWVVFPHLARRNGLGQNRGGSATAAPRKLSYQERDQVMREITAGRKVQAIKLYRSMTGADLVTARNTVEAWSRGLPS